MSTYVMSDIHGQYDTFIRMLKKINFSNEDALYILGDIMDRGPENLKVLKYIMENKNIILLRGNHEEMLLYYYRTKNHNDMKLWFRNGGNMTQKELEEVDTEKLKEYIDFLNNLSLCKFIEINNKEYLLVHAGIHPDTDESLLRETIESEDPKELLWIEEDALWIRHEFLLFKNNFPFTIIFGHTPTITLPRYLHKVPDELEESILNSKITKWHNKIAIDCGCAGAIQLGCLRLDDMEEFYEKCIIV